MTAQILQFPWERMPRDYVLAQVRELAAESPDEILVLEPVGDSVVLEIAGKELWFSIEEFSDIMLCWAQKLSDHSAELLAVAEEMEK